MASESSSMLKKKNSTHFIYLRLRDGSNDVIARHLPMHKAHEGNKLASGDIIHLKSFTPLARKLPSHLAI